MRIRTSVAAASLLAVTTFVFWAYLRNALSGFEAPTDSQSGREMRGRGGFEVWVADQSDTRPGFGGQLVIRLMAVVPMTNALQQAGQAPDAHGLRVRLRR